MGMIEESTSPTPDIVKAWIDFYKSIRTNASKRLIGKVTERELPLMQAKFNDWLLNLIMSADR